MCKRCDSAPGLARRTVLGWGLGAGLGSLADGAKAAGGHAQTTAVTADEALERLNAGNRRFVQGPEVCAVDLARQRQSVAASQAPWATIVSCADSRVPPELLFGGTGPGELFVARNAGAMVDTATMGTIEYGAAVLGVPLIVVLGHERCGAVAAACDVVTKKAQFPGSIGPMVKAIVPAARAVAGQAGDMVDNAVQENARRTARHIMRDSAIVAGLIRKGRVKVVAGRYDLDDGSVSWLS